MKLLPRGKKSIYWSGTSNAVKCRFDATRYARLSTWQEPAQTADLPPLFRGYGVASYNHKAEEEAVEYNLARCIYVSFPPH